MTLVLRSFVLLGVASAVLTEALSPFHLIGRPALIAGWLLVAGVAAVWAARNPSKLSRPAIGPLEIVIAASVGAIVALLALTACLSPPNTFDALAYHMPRIVYRAQAGSVAFFPTPYLSQTSAVRDAPAHQPEPCSVFADRAWADCERSCCRAVTARPSDLSPAGG